MKTGFSGAELFRKYLWYALRERKFDPDTVADLIHLRQQLNLTDDEARRQQGQVQGLFRVRELHWLHTLEPVQPLVWHALRCDMCLFHLAISAMTFWRCANEVVPDFAHHAPNADGRRVEGESEAHLRQVRQCHAGCGGAPPFIDALAH